MSVQFRQAGMHDLPQIITLLADDELGSTREDASLPLDQRYTAAFAAISRDANQFLAVVERDGAIVGCLQLSFVPGLSRLGMWRGQIESVRIAASERGAGLEPFRVRWNHSAVLNLVRDRVGRRNA